MLFCSFAEKVVESKGNVGNDDEDGRENKRKPEMERVQVFRKRGTDF